MAAPGLGICGGRYLRGNTHFGGGQDKISRNLPSSSLPKFLTPWIFFHTYPNEIFSRTFLIFSRPFKIVPANKIFHGPTKNFSQTYQNVIFLATFHKFLQFCLSNSDFPTTFGNFSQKSPLRCGSYSHGSERLMISTEIIKNWGGGQMGGQKIILGGHFPPCPPPPWRRHCLSYYN